MNYNSIQGNFGAFHRELNFAPGLNVIYGENEQGKSTACAFIRAMLYGVSGSARETKNALPDKTKYAPWDGSPMAGTLTLEWHGRELRLTRGPDKSGAMKAFSAVTTDTGAPIPHMNGTNAGVMLTGVAAEVFDRSYFGSVDAMNVSDNAALAERISAATGTGDASVSPAAVDACLARWQNELKHGKSGTIPQLEAEIADLEAEINTLEQINAKILEHSAELNRCIAKRDIVAAELKNAQNRLLAERITKNNTLKKQLRVLAEDTAAFIREHNLRGDRADSEAVARGEAALRTLAGLETELNIARSRMYLLEKELQKEALPKEFALFAELSPESAEALAKRDGEAAAKLQKSTAHLFLFWLSAFLTILFAAAGISVLMLTSVRFDKLIPAFATFGLAFFSCAWSVKEMINHIHRRRQLSDLFDKWNTQRVEDFERLAQSYGAYVSDQRRQKQTYEDNAAAITKMQDKLTFAKHTADRAVENLSLPKENTAAAAAKLLKLSHDLDLRRQKLQILQTAIDPKLPEMPPALQTAEESGASEEQLNGVHSALCSAIRTHELELERLKGQSAAKGDLILDKARLERLKDQLEEQNGEYKAITAARAFLGECTDQLARTVTPVLTERAEALFTFLTYGRYGSLRLNKELEASVVPEGEAVARKLLYLSKGAVDQAWLAVRLAVSEMLTETKESVPLLLDDIFAMYDDERAKRGMELLASLAKERQIILFTCRHRDTDAAAALGATILEYR